MNNNDIVAFPERKSIRTQASEWIARLEVTEPTADVKREFKQWVNENPAHRAEFERLSAIWADLNQLTQITLPAEYKWYQAKESTHGSSARRFSVLGINAGVFASVAVMLVAVTLLVTSPWQQQPRYYQTAIGEQKTITLPDNSVVDLNTNSRIKLDYSDARRGIYLMQGEAHFSVRKDKARPFEVQVGTGLVRAIGTVFNVRLSLADIEVIVSEGVVEIDSIDNRTEAPIAPGHLPSEAPSINLAQAPSPSPERLEAGQQATFRRTELDLVQREQSSELSRKLGWRDGTLEFKRDLLQDVVAEVSRYTEKNIIIADKRAAQIRVGGRFKVGDTEALLEVLESGFGITVSYEKNNTIYLSYDAPLDPNSSITAPGAKQPAPTSMKL